MYLEQLFATQDGWLLLYRTLVDDSPGEPNQTEIYVALISDDGMNITKPTKVAKARARTEPRLQRLGGKVYLSYYQDGYHWHSIALPSVRVQATKPPTPAQIRSEFGFLPNKFVQPILSRNSTGSYRLLRRGEGNESATQLPINEGSDYHAEIIIDGIPEVVSDTSLLLPPGPTISLTNTRYIIASPKLQKGTSPPAFSATLIPVDCSP